MSLDNLALALVNPNARIPVFVGGDVNGVLAAAAHKLPPMEYTLPAENFYGLGLIGTSIHNLGEGIFTGGDVFFRPSSVYWSKKDFSPFPITQPTENEAVIAPYHIAINPSLGGSDVYGSVSFSNDAPITGAEVIDELASRLEPGHYVFHGTVDATQANGGYLLGSPKDEVPLLRRKGSAVIKRGDGIWPAYNLKQVSADVKAGMQFREEGNKDEVTHGIEGTVSIEVVGALYVVGQKGPLENHGGKRTEESFLGEEHIMRAHYRHPAIAKDAPLSHFHGKTTLPTRQQEVFHLNLNAGTLVTKLNLTVYRNDCLILR